MTKNRHRVLFLSAFITGIMTTFAQNAQLLPYKSPQWASVKSISANGKWATGHAPGDNNGAFPFIWNLETDEITDIFTLDATEATGYDISDDGTVAGSIENVPAVYERGEWNYLPLPKGFTEGYATGISADGRVIIGYTSMITENQETKIKPCKWIDRKPVDLIVPEKDSRDQDATANKLEYISSDGNTILGRLNYIYPMSSTPVLWQNESAPFFICHDIYYREDGSRNQTSISGNINLSGNGKFVTGYAAYDTGDPNNFFASFLYNTQTMETAIYNREKNEASGYAVDNNGTAYESAGRNAMRTAYIRIDGVQYLLNDYLNKEYGFDVTTSGYKDLGTVIGISDDCKTLVGFDIPGSNWCMKLSKAPPTSSISTEKIENISVAVNGKVITIYGNAHKITLNRLTGETVLSRKISGNTVDINSIQEGIYILTIGTDEQEIVRKIAIK